MVTNERTLKVLEWHTVLEHLSIHATSEIGKSRCLSAELFSGIEKITQELKLTTEARFLLDHALFPPLEGIRSIADGLNSAKIGQTLINQELIDIANTIGAARRLKSFFSRNQEENPRLYNISIDLFENKSLEEEILDIFDENAEIKENASPELKGLMSSYRDQQHNLKNKLNNLIQSSTFSKYLQENVYTQRGDRYVVPVKAEFKSMVQGIVHDISSSGATLFIEPKALVDLNNSLKETELKIGFEIKRILSQLSSKIQKQADEILFSLDILAEIDFIFAKAKYSIQLKASEPAINNKKYLSFQGVKHPILLKTLEQVIPNDVEIGKDWNTLIITGSNTGGKTVILKTVGLCTLMAKAGFHVPAVNADIYPFKNIFADIGDEQSITQNLSTFSGHMINIINILNDVDDNSLVLLDEIGAGTDPQEGASLAQAIMGNLSKKGAISIVTTHYGELKSLAYTKQGFYNASVEFDSTAPTYKLLMGIPGKSNAITIAQNLGLDPEITQEAQHIYFTQKDQTGKVLEGLQNTQQELSKNAKIVESTKDELEKLKKEYDEKLEKLNAEKKKTTNIYKKKFDAELLTAKLEIKEIIDEIRRTKSEKIARRSFNRIGEIESGLKSSVNQEMEKFKPEYQLLDWTKAKSGDNIFIPDLEQEGVLLGTPDKHNNVQVEIGRLKTQIKANRIVKSHKKTAENPEKINYSRYRGYSINRSNIENKLDIRGMTVDDGINAVESYLDKASLANLTPVYIIHGHGKGALRDAVRNYLKTSPYVAKFRPGMDNEGGNGVTIVDLA